MCIIGALASNAEKAPESARVLVLDIDDEIDAAAWRHTRGAIRELNDARPPFDLFLIKLNTYGGAVDMADSIRSALLRLKTPTVAFVDHNAASAGALVVLSCDSAYMAPGSSIGAATVVNGQGEPMPVKYQSYWSTIMRSTAMSHGKTVSEGDSMARWRRDPEIFADMVNPERALSFTTQEAVEAGIVDGVASDVHEVLAQLGINNAEITYYTPSFTDTLMGFLASAAVRAILITLILGGIYMEMHTPGLGVAAAVALVATVLFFMPMVVGGTLAAWVVILFIIGVVALALEMFVIPGFGIAGVIGIVAIIASLIGAMSHSDPLDGFSFHSVRTAVIVILAGVAMAAGLAWLITSRFAPKRLQRAGALTLEQKIDDGYVGVDMSPSELVGCSGIALTPLRPAGKVKIGENTYDATSTGEFIAKKSRVRVVKYEAAQIYVEKE